MSHVIQLKESSATQSAEASLDVPPGYKRTEAGVLPEDWIVSSVGSEFRVQLGKMLDAARNVGILKPYIGNRAVQWCHFDLQYLAEVPMTPADLKRFRLRRNDLLVCEGGEIGRAAVWDDAIPECYYQKALHRLRPKRGYDVFLMMSFLYLWVSSGYLGNYVTQTSIAHLPKDKLELVPLPVPSPAEQRAIAKALSDVDELLTALEALIAKKRAIKQATMQQLLTAKTRLSGFSGDWETISLGELFEFKNGLNKPKRFFGHGTPIVNYMDVFKYSTLKPSMLKGRVQLTRREIQNFDVRKGDVFFTRTSETTDEIGIASVMIEDAPDTVFSGFVLRARPKTSRIYNGFKAYCFASKFVRDQIVATASYTTRALTNGKLLSEVSLSLPQEAEQIAISQTLSDVDAEIAALEARRDKTRAIKQGMMQQLLTGRIRLVKPQPAEVNA